MVIYCKSVHFGGFSGPGTSGQAFYEMASFSEGRALRLLQESGEPLSLRPTILAIWTGQDWACPLALQGPNLAFLALCPDRTGGVGRCVFSPPSPSLMT